MGFPRQEYWTGLPVLSPGDLPDPGIKPASPAGSRIWQADSLPLATKEASGGGISVLMKEIPLLLLPGTDPKRRQVSGNQEVGPHQTSNLPKP